MKNTSSIILHYFHSNASKLINVFPLDPSSFYEPAEKLRLRLIDPKREYHRLFTFLSVAGMEPTNNHAEPTLRLPVFFRKICFGNRSDEGAESMGVILSLMTTARRQKKDPLTFVQQLLTDKSNRNILFEHLPSP